VRATTTDHDPAQVRVRVAVNLIDPGPGPVQLDQAGLHQVLGRVSVPGEQDRDPQVPLTARSHERGETHLNAVITRHHAFSPPSKGSQAAKPEVLSVSVTRNTPHPAHAVDAQPDENSRSEGKGRGGEEMPSRRKQNAAGRLEPEGSRRPAR
jgi:hypothetical protein